MDHSTSQSPHSAAASMVTTTADHQRHSSSSAAPAAPPAELCCPICRELLDKAVKVKECGHVFCSLCIRQTFSAQKEKGSKHHRQYCACPTCITQGFGRSFQQSTTIRNYESSLIPATSVQQQVDEYRHKVQNQQVEQEQQDQQHQEEEEKKQIHQSKQVDESTAGASSSSSSSCRRSTRSQTVNLQQHEQGASTLTDTFSSRRSNENQVEAGDGISEDEDNDMDDDYQEQHSQKEMQKPPQSSPSFVTASTASSQYHSRTATVASGERPISEKKPKIFYTKQKRKQLQELCRQEGLSEMGTDAQLADRHRRFVTMWNAELDCEDVNKRKRPTELREEFRKQERSSDNTTMKSKYGHRYIECDGYSRVEFTNQTDDQDFHSNFIVLMTALEARTPNSHSRRENSRSKWSHLMENRKINDITNTNSQQSPMDGESIRSTNNDKKNPPRQPPKASSKTSFGSMAQPPAAGHIPSSTVLETTTMKNPYSATKQNPNRNYSESLCLTTNNPMSASMSSTSNRAIIDYAGGINTTAASLSSTNSVPTNATSSARSLTSGHTPSVRSLFSGQKRQSPLSATRPPSSSPSSSQQHESSHRNHPGPSSSLSAASTSSASKRCRTTETRTTTNSATSSSRTTGRRGGLWSCIRCTWKNPSCQSTCEMCFSERDVVDLTDDTSYV